MKAIEVIELIEEFSPKCLAVFGDNVGVQVGLNLNKKIKKIGMALDPSLEVIEKAKMENIDFLFTHHPILKDPVKNFTGPLYKKLKILTENDIILYSAHTNLDICKNGLNDSLAELFNLKDVKNLYDDGLGRIGNFEGTFNDILKITNENICKNPEIILKKELINKKSIKLAVLSGYGLSQNSIVHVSNLADVYLSGDLTHHSKIIAKELGLTVIDGTHYGTEVYGLKNFFKYLKGILKIPVVSLDF